MFAPETLGATPPLARHDRPARAFRELAGGLYALAARRHMHEFGTTSEQLAEIAVGVREAAALNPNAL